MQLLLSLRVIRKRTELENKVDGLAAGERGMDGLVFRDDRLGQGGGAFYWRRYS
jgi:hypothetical protein